ncbi:MAG TPA: hypothetical protein EYN92_02605 [Dehalococcoidia bacterium]|jgi:hypothetical protein|nr:hypothetical protein [Dehalococcoidia bacterium]
MLFHVTVDHTAESCPLVTNSPEKRMTAAGAEKAGVKLVSALGGRPQHRTVYVVDTDDIDKLYDFLSPALSWAKCDIMPVRELDV